MSTFYEYGSGGGGAIAIPLVSGGLKDCLKGLGYGAIGTIKAIGAAIASGGAYLLGRSKVKEKTVPLSNTTTSKNQKKPTLIYRSASGTYKSLTPRPIDANGLSFYLKPPVNGKYVITTVEIVNATGTLTAKVDGPNHCSVMPTIPSTMSSWIASRDNADNEPHPYSVILKSIVWDVK